MNGTKYLCVLLWSLLLIGSSCTVEKRLYNKGFHVQWNKNLHAERGNHSEQEERIPSVVYDETVEHAKLSETSSELIVPLSADALVMRNEEGGEIGNVQFKRSASRVNHYMRSSESFDDDVFAESIVSQRIVKKGMKHAEPATVGTNQIVALVLVLLVGVLGIHRFYLGYYGIGILMILTLGFCGILALIDLIRIAVGDLKPKNEEYTETL